MSISKRALTMTLAIAVVGATRLHAQVVTIAPGMTTTQVVAKLGQPLSTRSFQSFTYLFYRNGCEKKCGMNDVVTLDGGKVVDAVFRSPGRHYSGTSSSPRAIPAAEASKGNPDARLSLPQSQRPPRRSARMSKPVYDKPSHNEEEYFARRDAELIHELRAERDAELTAAERRSHHMKCPKCGAQLVETERRGIKINACPECHGMWVDQGEIDLINQAGKQHSTSHMMQDIIAFFHRPNHPNHK